MMRNRIRKILRESDFDWVKDYPISSKEMYVIQFDKGYILEPDTRDWVKEFGYYDIRNKKIGDWIMHVGFNSLEEAGEYLEWYISGNQRDYEDDIKELGHPKIVKYRLNYILEFIEEY